MTREKKPVTIHVITYAGPESEILTKELYTPFEEETGINVEVDVFDEPTMREKEIADFVAGTGKYDVVRLQHWHAPKYFEKDWLYPLDEFIEEDNWDLTQYPKGAVDMYRHEGNLYSIPDTLLTNIMIYRKDIFEEQGWEVPETTEEYLDLLENFKTLQEETGQYSDMSGTWVRGYKSFDAFGGLGGWIWAYGAKILEDHQVNVYTDNVLEAVKDWVRMAREYGPAGESTMGWVKGGALYAKGSILMQSEVSGFINYVQNPEKSDVVGKNGFALSPVAPAGRHIQWSFSTGLAINKDSKHKEEAWEFIKWRNSEEAYRIEIKNDIRVDMPFLPAYEWPIHENLAEEWGVENAMDTLAEAHKYATFEYWPKIPEFTDVVEALNSQVSLAIAGEKSVDTALSDAQGDIEDILEEAGY